MVLIFLVKVLVVVGEIEFRVNEMHVLDGFEVVFDFYWPLDTWDAGGFF